MARIRRSSRSTSWGTTWAAMPSPSTRSMTVCPPPRRLRPMRQSTGGDLDATDVDGPATFVAQTNVAGSNGYGHFSINAAGTWTYTMDSPHNEFVAGHDYTDSLVVATDDGTTKTIVVTIHGTND